MTSTLTRRAAVRVFGQEGDVALDARAQAVILASAVLVTDVGLLSPLIADLAGVFGVSEVAAGLLIIAYTATVTVLVPVMGTLADRIGRRAVFVPGLTLFGLAGAAIGLVPSFEAAIALRILQAAGFAAAMPVAIALLGDLYTEEREATAQGIRTAGINVTIMSAPVVSGLLFVSSWRYPFAVYLLALPVAAWAWTALPEVDTGEAKSLASYARDLGALLSERSMAILLATFVTRFALLYAFFTYISVLAIRSVGVSVVVAGAIVSLKGIVSLLSSTQTGRVAARTDPVLRVVATLLVSGAGVALMGASPGLPALLAAVVVYAVGDGLLSPSQKSLLNRTASVELRGGAVSIATTFQNVGKVVGPSTLGALLIVLGPASAFMVVGVLGASVGVLLLVGGHGLRG